MSELYYINVDEDGTYVITTTCAYSSGHTVAGPYDSWGEAYQALREIEDQEDSDVTDLELCPFCGEGEFRHKNRTGYTGQIACPPHYRCTNCGVSVSWYPEGSIYYDIDTRPIEDALRAENERLLEVTSKLYRLVCEHGGQRMLAHASDLLGISREIAELSATIAKREHDTKMKLMRTDAQYAQQEE